MPNHSDPITMPNLGVMFNLDCFHFNEVKNTIEKIFKHLMSMDHRLDLFEDKLKNVPDFSKLLQKLKYLEDKLPSLEKKCDDTKMFAEATKKDLHDQVYKERVRGDDFDKRIKNLVAEIERLKGREQGVGYKEFYLLRTRVEHAEESLKTAELKIGTNSKDIFKLNETCTRHGKSLTTIEEQIEWITGMLDEKIDKRDWIKKADIT